ncbi:MAG: hypothetical protein ACOY3L_09825 [Pseudomonadota bacterium]
MTAAGLVIAGASRRPARWGLRLLLGLALLAIAAAPAWAHAAEKAFVLLLPTRYYIVGGTFAVAASFLLLLLVPSSALRRILSARVDLGPLPRISATATSAGAFVLLVLLLATGWLGSRDPLENPLPLTVWTLWWGGLTLTHALFGNLWALLNPWIAPCRLVRHLFNGPGSTEQPLLTYPAWFGYGPAILGSLAFAWFELVDPAPDDPARLALAAAVYSGITLTGMLLFGERAWLSKAECFSVFFGFVALLAPFRVESLDPARPGRRRLYLTCPGASLAMRDALPMSGVLFVLLTLASVSFDGLSETFWWLGLGGINPLEFPGRSAVVGRNSLGLVVLWAGLVLAYGLAIAAGHQLAGGPARLKACLGAFVLSILPISIGYHLAHYLTAFLVNMQYAVLAISDPFAKGWDLLGRGRPEVTVSFLSNFDAVSVIWKLQAGAVVLVHVMAVMLAHAIAVERYGTTRAAIASQLPLAALMIGYTLFGLWLLSTPTAG